MNARELEKYLRKGHLRPLEPLEPPRAFRHFIVLPVMDELAELPGTLRSLVPALAAAPEKIGVLLVVNHGESAAPERQAANLETLARLRQGDPEFCAGLRPGENLFWIDAASPGKTLRHGVGEARRIGLDSALGRLAPETLDAALLYSLDADSPVAPEYFVRIGEWFATHPEYGSASLAVRHRLGPTPEAERAIRAYEAYMLAYVEALREAGSPYAFHTIGSAIVARATVYVGCGGMRVREGAEDFYFLQALRKVAPVGEYPMPLVFPAGRPSDRVPFGTGPAIRSQLRGEALPVYPATGFAELKKLLDAADDTGLRDPAAFRKRLSEPARRFLDAGDFFTLWPRVLANLPRRPGAAREAFDRWFDALKTLQFIRFE